MSALLVRSDHTFIFAKVWGGTPPYFCKEKCVVKSHQLRIFCHILIGKSTLFFAFFMYGLSISVGHVKKNKNKFLKENFSFSISSRNEVGLAVFPSLFFLKFYKSKKIKTITVKTIFSKSIIFGFWVDMTIFSLLHQTLFK